MPNREIKFRAYLRGDHEGICDDGLTQVIGYGTGSDAAGYDYNPMIKNGHYYTRNDEIGLSVELPDIELEQYTGLKDKNGKEIYEGDIVSSHQGDVLSQIVWMPSGEYRMQHIGIYGGGCPLLQELGFVDIIGNIHENPELLDQAKHPKPKEEIEDFDERVNYQSY